MPRFDLANYVDVQERIVAFWAKYPDGAILTELMSDPHDFTQCRYKATVYRNITDPMPGAVDFAFELASSDPRGGANFTSHEENCSTSAIGRALATLGFAKSREDRPSQQEMGKVNRMSEQAPAPRTTPVAQPSARSAQQAPRQIMQPDAPASDPQKNAIFAISSKKWGPNAETNRHLLLLARHGVKSSNDLTKAQASDVIDFLSKASDDDINGLIADEAMAQAEAG